MTHFTARVRLLFRNIVIASIIAILINTFLLDTTKVTSESMENTILAGDFFFVEKLSYGAKFPASLPILDFLLPEFRMPGLSEVERGDVLLFESPVKSFYPNVYEDRNFVKRCVALPGDTLVIKNRVIIINNITTPISPGIKFINSNKNRHFNLFASDKNWTLDNYGPVFVPGKGSTIALEAANLQLYYKIINEESAPDTLRITDNDFYLGGSKIEQYTFKNNYYFVMGDNRNQSSDSRFWGFLKEEDILGRVFMIYMSIDFYNAEENDSFLSRVRWSRIAKLIN